MLIAMILMWIAALWAAVYCFSYGVYIWKRKNKPGAIFTFLLSVCSFVLMVWATFQR